MLFGESLVWHDTITQCGVDKMLKKLLWPDNFTREDLPASRGFDSSRVAGRSTRLQRPDYPLGDTNVK